MIRKDLNLRRLDQLIQIKQRVDSINTQTGAPEPTYQDFAQVYAAVDATRNDSTARALEEFNADQKLAYVDYTVWIYWRGDLDATMIIDWNGRILEIVGIPDNQRRGMFMSLFCVQGKSIQ